MGDRVGLGGLAFLLCGYAALAAGIYFLLANTVFWIRAEAASGTVVGWQAMEHRPTSRTRFANVDPARAIVVSFTPAGGEEIIFATEWGSGKAAYASGEKVTVLYDPDEPADARIRGFVSLYVGPLLLLVFGAVFWFVGTLIRGFAEATSRPRRPR